MTWAFITALLVLGGGLAANAQVEQQKGFVFYESFQGSTNSEGQVMTLGSSATYWFNEHFSAGLGIPIYFNRSSSTTTATTTTSGTTSSNGIGNFYADIGASWKGKTLNFTSSLTGAAPTGDTKKGLSTGHATYDWSNRFDHAISRLTPFGVIGIADTVMDSRFFQRPFTSFGNLAHLEGGADVDLSHSFTLTLSAYDIAPWGSQTIISRLVPAGATGTGGQHGRTFETTHQATGNSSLDRDHGFAVGLDASPKSLKSAFDFDIGYNRSVPFALNTISFGVGINLSKLFSSSGN
jgi:hypothetical protein